MSMGQPGREVKLGIIGLGGRGRGQMALLATMPDVSIAAVCDLYEDRVKLAHDHLVEQGRPAPRTTQDYREVLLMPEVEAVVIMTSWQTHIQIAVDAMRAGKIVAMEVGGASSLDECWQMVHASEQTGMGCMLLENCCYGKEEMTLLNMVRQGLFGELVHCQGGYLHDLRSEIGKGDIKRHYRLGNFMHRNGELYPTHELGPIAKYLNLNRGNRMVSLVSMASKARGQSAWLKENRAGDPLCDVTFNQGDIVTTMIRCANGETILLTHDCTLPRPYSRGGRIQGTKGIWQEDNRGIYIDGRSPVDEDYWTHRWESDEAYMAEYCHPLWTEYEAFGRRGGHGGMDYLVLRGFIESIQQGKPFPIDVYDTAAWMAITALSEESIAMGSLPVPVPDFTNGKWMGPRVHHEGPYALDW